MGQRFLLDTNIVIEFLRDNIPSARKNELVSIIMVETNISIVTKIETLGWLPPDKNEERLIIEFIADCTVFNLTDDIVDKTIELRKTYKKLALPDAIIAATALTHNLTLVSRNDADFQRIKKLRYTNPFNL
jgi:predicted nucleic acid-binding protein